MESLENILKKTYVITTAQKGGKVNHQLYNSMLNYCKENNAEMLILPTNGKTIDDTRLDKILTENHQVIDSKYSLNKNIQISNFEIRPQQIQPTTGLARFAQGDKSFIFASPKQEIKVIPNSKQDLPKILMTTGAITQPYYKLNTRIGRIAKTDHRYGFIVVDVEDKNIYHYRNVVAKTNGTFIDLGKSYSKNKVKNVRPDAMVLGDWHTGETDKKVRAETFNMIEKYNPKRVVLHDIFNNKSISHHSEGRLVEKYRDYTQSQLSLDLELKNVAKEIKYFVDNTSDDTEIIIVKSNHDEGLERYLNETRFINEPQNALISSKLLTAALEEKDPLKYGIAMFYDIPDRVKFLRRDQEYKVRGYQLGNHGDIVAKGMRGSVRSKENAFGKSISGHCFSDDTEILTKKGWIKGINLSLDDEVMTMNKKTRNAEWNKVDKLNIFDNYSELFHLKSKACDLLITDKHGLIAEDVNGNLQEFTAKEFSTIKNQFKFLNALSTTNTGEYDHDMLRLIVQIVTDGSYDDGSIRWHLKKERKIKSLVGLLEEMNIKFSLNLQTTGTTKIRISVKESKHLIKMLPDKQLPDWFMSLSKECIDVILEEYSLTDGCVYSSRRYQLSTSKKHNADLLQALCVLIGYRCSIFNREKDGYTTNYALNITKTNKIWMKKEHISKVPYPGKVWCPTVKNGTLVVRRNGKVLITQNSHSPLLFRDVCIVGTSTELDLRYMKGASDWMHTHAMLYNNATVQLVNIVNGKHTTRYARS